MRSFSQLRFALVAGALAVATGAMAQSSQPPAAPPSDKPAVGPPQTRTQTTPGEMRFQLVKEGPADLCGTRCREWVMANGQIVASTARTFAEFAAGKDLRGAVVVLDSSGGAVGASLALGQMFRRLGITTTIGRTTKLQPDDNGVERATLTYRAVCASACVFAFIGGAQRHVAAESRVYVHQIWPVNKREDAMATTYSAVEMVRVQRELGHIARHIVEMGGHISLFETSMRIPPWEQLKALSRDDIAAMNLNTVPDPFAVPRPTTPAPSARTTAAAPSPATLADQGGWTAAAQGGAQNLVRKHILTLEGEPIGSFELSLTCGSKPGSYALAYNETRRLHVRGGERVRVVMVALSNNEKVQLKIDSSTSDAATAELKTAARGDIPATILAGLSREKGGLFVATQTIGNARTIIRVGNTGFADAFKRTLAECKS